MQHPTNRAPSGAARRRSAIVVGGGIAGLLAARVLRESFDEVTLLERGPLPDKPDFRKGTPQDRHPHLMLAAGERILHNLFPGLDAELAEAGAPSADIGADCLFHFETGQVPRFESGLRVRLCSRALWEWSIRRRVLQDRSIRLVEGAEVTGLLPGDRGVAGVRARHGAGPAGSEGEQRFPADLVVLSDGRSSRATSWLDDLGYPRPEETVVNSHSGYSSRWFQAEPGRFDDVRLAVDFSSPPDRYHGGLVLAAEGRRYVLVIAGAGGRFPPTDPAEFEALVSHMRVPLFSQIVAEMKPISPIYGYRHMENRHRHFERMARWPERLLVIGDAAISLNPVYGQGMTAAATAAQALKDALAEAGSGPLGGGFARRFQGRLVAVSRDAWSLATGSDYRWPETEGTPLNPAMRLLQKYSEQVTLAMPESILVARTFFEVMHGIRPASALARPAVLAEVLGRTARRAARASRWFA